MISQIATSTIFKYLLIMVISSIKFLFAPLLSFEIGLTFIQTWITTTIGGLTGVIFFYFLSKYIISVYQRFFAIRVLRFVHHITIYVRQGKFIPKPQKRIFSYRNKALVRIRRRFGLFGIIILTPVLLSIPLGTFLALKYYPQQKHILPYLSLSVIMWSFLMSSAMTIF